MENEKIRPRINVVRKVALNLLKGMDVKCAPVYIRDIFKYLKEQGIEVEFYERDLGDGYRGLQITDPEEENDLIIAINKNQHENSKRFTVGHELGYYFLKHNQHRHIYHLDVLEAGKIDLIELEANQFAAELLMPTYILKEDLKNNVGDIQTLATKYKVSTLAMGWKISNTAGLLNSIY